MYLKAKVILTKKKNELTKTTTNESGATSANSTLAAEQGVEHLRENLSVTIANNQTGLQLVPTDLPIFNGKNPEEWPYFRTVFTQLVHTNSQYFPLAKYNILKQHLRGDAAALIVGLSHREENYEIAWDMLKQEYDNPQLIVNSLLSQLNDLRPMPKESPSSLRFVVTRFKQVTTQLAAANVDVTTWDPMLTYQFSGLLDPITRRDWELHCPRNKSVKFKDMLNYMDDRVKALLNAERGSRRLQSAIVRPPSSNDNYNRSRSSTPTTGTRYNSPTTNTRYNSPTTNTRYNSPMVGHVSKAAVASKRSYQSTDDERCPVCKGGNHPVEECDKFLQLNCYPRMERARSLKLCFGCLERDHTLQTCTVPICSHCDDNRKHHRLLCFKWCDKERKSHPMVALVNQIQLEMEQQQEVLLATAIVTLHSPNGQKMIARAFCDNGGQANLITQEFARRLQLPKRSSNASIQPIGEGNLVNVCGAVSVVVTSTDANHPAFQTTINALVTRRICSPLPSSPVNVGIWPKDISENLADPTAGEPSGIDILLGAQVWAKIILPNIHVNQTNGLTAQSSQFGWLLIGGLKSPQGALVGYSQVSESSTLNETLQRFWELESVTTQHHRSPEEQLCFEIFERETYRNEDGRYVVPIPIDPNAALLGDSRMRALQRWFQMENKFKRDEEYHRQYVAFMRDYVDRGHMSLITDQIDLSNEHYFIPHHGIMSAKKFRVVFDGSVTTTSGQSSNDIQLKGERLQDNLTDILWRFRLHKIALTADVQQMYRQILVKEDQRNLMLIFYRDDPTQNIKIYRLNTVTYGLKHAPHSAVSALQLCARQHQESHPSAAAVTLKDYYMDDLTTGGDTPEEVAHLYHEMKEMMGACGFPLRKWATNDWNVLSSFDLEDIPNTEPIELRTDEVTSVLGTYWRQMSDEFMFKIGTLENEKPITKRVATSEVAKLFDPTGLLAAVIAKGKLMIRKLWLLKVGWDEILPEKEQNEWLNYFNSLKQLEEIRVPRWMGTTKQAQIELHGFSDASEYLYAATVYYRTTSIEGFVRTGILAAKTKVAPLKTISIPRLELSGALLLSRLMTQVKNALSDRTVTCQYWSDSTITLAWIKQSPHLLKTFVANRVSEIQTSTSGCSWRHVPTHDNPADIASRGIDASDLINNNLWWSGPKWLIFDPCGWPGVQSLELTETDKSEMCAETKSPLVAMGKIEDKWIATRYSCFSKLCVVTAFVMRFVRNLKAKKSVSKQRSIEPITSVKPLTREEMEESERFWIIQSQGHDFSKEIKSCKASQQLPLSSKLRGLKPFVDENGILRVGGRLQNASIPFAAKFPIILHGQSSLTKLIIRRAHLQMLHSGNQLTARTLRERYWIIGGRKAIRGVIYDCVTCVRQRGNTCTQQLCNLVEQRVSPQKPFSHISIDYCGPFEVKRFAGRCKTIIKVHVLVIVCMSTRAIHLEVVLNQTTDAFIDAFQQFVSRRGCCLTITSDNAKTFVGAKRKFDDLAEFYRKCSHSTYFASRKIEWKFIMPRSPSQGGSHESAVKLFKYHLRRVIGANQLSITEFTSLVIRIEGCLNSRPLAVQTDDGTDVVAITPAMLVTGYPLYEVTPVEPELLEEPITNNHIRKIQFWHQSLWRLWQSDYINSLQCRGRWQNEQENIKKDDVVLIKEDNIAPSYWLMARVIATHPGKDGLVRNVTLKCTNPSEKESILQRAIQKLVKLPVVAGCHGTNRETNFTTNE